MNFAQQAHNPVRRFGGLSIVVIVHVVLAYALISNLARTTLNILRPPVETRIIEEIKPPPPPENTSVPPPPVVSAPPPPYMPPPEVHVQAPPSVNTITAITAVPPAPAPFEKTVAPPTPVAPEPLKTVILKAAPPPPVPAFVDLNACKPDYPRAALLAEEQGTVRVQFVIGSDGELVSAKVLKSSGYEDLDRAAIHGLSRCQFKAAMKEGKPVQSSFTSDYVWNLDQ